MSEVKRLTVDLGRDIARLLSAAQFDTWEERALAAVGGWVRVGKVVSIGGSLLGVSRNIEVEKC